MQEAAKNDAVGEYLNKLPKYTPRKMPPLLTARKFQIKDPNKVHSRCDLTTNSNFCHIPGSFKLGDIVWAKCAKFPYWPALIVIDPVRKNKKFKFYQTNNGNINNIFYLSIISFFLINRWLSSVLFCSIFWT